MARRSEHSKEQIRDMALEAAETIVATDGLAGLSAYALWRFVIPNLPSWP